MQYTRTLGTGSTRSKMMKLAHQQLQQHPQQIQAHKCTSTYALYCRIVWTCIHSLSASARNEWLEWLEQPRRSSSLCTLLDECVFVLAFGCECVCVLGRWRWANKMKRKRFEKRIQNCVVSCGSMQSRMVHSRNHLTCKCKTKTKIRKL